VRTAPVEIGSQPLRVLQGLYVAAGLPGCSVCSEKDSDPRQPVAPMRRIYERRGQTFASRAQMSGVLARDAVLEVLATYRLELQSATTSAEVNQITAKTRARLEDLQGERNYRHHFAKSLSQMATALRKRGWVTIALDLLDWAIDNGVVDTYIVNDAIQCHLATGDLDAAEKRMAIANQNHLANDGMYAALVETNAKTGNVPRARELFDEAAANHLAGEFCHTAMIDGYGKAGLTGEAEAIFNGARALGFRSAGIFTAIIDTYGKRGELTRAQQLFDEAKSLCADRQSIYTALIDAYGNAGDWKAAERLFDELRASVIPSRHSYAALLSAHGKAGNVRRARNLFNEAKERGALSPIAYLTLMKIYQERGCSHQAHRLLRRARAERVW
jgi:pentatricopeptide repeat protein